MRALVMHPGCLSKSAPSPLIVYLHGWNQSGNGKTVAELQHVKDRGSRGLLANLERLPSLRASLIFAPQCPKGSWWDVQRVWKLVKAYVDSGIYHIDNIVLVGVSMGGYAAFEMLHSHADAFSSVVIIGGGDD